MVGLALCGCRDEPPPSLAESALEWTLATTCPGTASVTDECRCRGVNAMAEMNLGASICETAIDYWLHDSRYAELIYDGVCAAAVLKRNSAYIETEAFACSVDAPPEPLLDCDDECQIYFGTAQVGEACERFGARMSTCAADLVCGIDALCHEPCDRPLEIPIGGDCGEFLGALVDEHCAPGSVCDPATSECTVPLAAGERCGDDLPPCPPDHSCVQPTATCEPQAAIGGACGRHYDCASHVCKDGACAEPDPWSCDHPWF